MHIPRSNVDGNFPMGKNIERKAMKIDMINRYMESMRISSMLFSPIPRSMNNTIKSVGIMEYLNVISSPD